MRDRRTRKYKFIAEWKKRFAGDWMAIISLASDRIIIYRRGGDVHEKHYGNYDLTKQGSLYFASPEDDGESIVSDSLVGIVEKVHEAARAEWKRRYNIQARTTLAYMWK